MVTFGKTFCISFLTSIMTRANMKSKASAAFMGCQIYCGYFPNCVHETKISNGVGLSRVIQGTSGILKSPEYNSHSKCDPA